VSIDISSAPDRTATDVRDASHAPPATAPRPSPERKLRLPRADVAVLIRRGLLLFGVTVIAFGVFLMLLSGLEHGRSQTGLERRLRVELANVQSPIGGDIAKGTPIAQLSIPDIGVHEVVVQGTDSGSTRKGPGHLPASPMPGQSGNVVLVGRHSAYGGPFSHLNSLDKGSDIKVITGQGISHYTVSAVRRFASKDGSFLVGSGDRLTLVTSEPALFASRRLVVTATLASQPFQSTDHPSKFGANELGLDGDTGGIVALVVWLEAMLVVALGGVWLFRRWNAWTAYVIVVPVVLAVSWLIFDSAAVLFPATL
jgi:sortase A